MSREEANEEGEVADEENQEEEGDEKCIIISCVCVIRFMIFVRSIPCGVL